jgi:hypothetical protein
VFAEGLRKRLLVSEAIAAGAADELYVVGDGANEVIALAAAHDVIHGEVALDAE